MGPILLANEALLDRYHLKVRTADSDLHGFAAPDYLWIYRTIAGAIGTAMQAIGSITVGCRPLMVNSKAVLCQLFRPAPWSPDGAWLTASPARERYYITLFELANSTAAEIVAPPARATAGKRGVGNGVRQCLPKWIMTAKPGRSGAFLRGAGREIACKPIPE